MKLGKGARHQDPGGPKRLNKISPKGHIPILVIIKLLKTNKVRIPKASRKNISYYKGIPVKIICDFLLETLKAKRKWLKCWKYVKCWKKR